MLEPLSEGGSDCITSCSKSGSSSRLIPSDRHEKSIAYSAIRGRQGNILGLEVELFSCGASCQSRNDQMSSEEWRTLSLKIFQHAQTTRNSERMCFAWEIACKHSSIVEGKDRAQPHEFHESVAGSAVYVERS